MNVELPILYRASQAWFAVFPAPIRGLTPLLPDPELRPVQVVPGKGAVVLAVFDYTDTSIGPYREVGLGIPCRYRRSTALPLLPMLAERWLDDVGPWVHLLPVTTELANEAGIKNWGFPKFVADITIDADGSRVACTVSEKGERVLTAVIERPGPSAPLRFPLRLYTRLHDELLLTELAVDAVGAVGYLGTKATLQLEQHPRVRALQGLGLDQASPIAVRWFDEYRTALDRARARYRIGV